MVTSPIIGLATAIILGLNPSCYYVPAALVQAAQAPVTQAALQPSAQVGHYNVEQNHS
jgi:hypothetical protein